MQEFRLRSLIIKFRDTFFGIFTALIIVIPQNFDGGDSRGPERYFADSSLIKTGIQCLAAGSYVQADSVWKRYIDLFPAHIEGYIFRAMTIQSQMLEFESSCREEELESVLNIINVKIDSLLQADPDNTYYIFQKANYEGLVSTDKAFQKSWLQAFSHGRKANGLYKTVLANDSTWTEALTGIGTYQYWKSSAVKPLFWLPFIDDNRKNGIYLLNKSIEPESYSYYFTIHQLAWIYYNTKDYNQAITTCRAGLIKYPESRLLLEAMGESHMKLLQYERAFSCFKKIRNSLKTKGYTGSAIFYKYTAKACEAALQMTAGVDISEMFIKLNLSEIPECERQQAQKYFSRIEKARRTYNK